ncbi:type II toxin-antitoxin system VapC family toxin [Akkermansiaceae bacterium]|nr:type II toxin-antitoxin system VapC family toxin [Akkermansiaceae bacterium]
MKLLFDTQAFLWWCLVAPQMTPAALAALDEAEQVFLSPVTLWEIGLKGSGRGFDFDLPKDWETVLPAHAERYQISWLAISPRHCRLIQDLPFHHRDPFDRMLIAQALEGGLSVIGSDEQFEKYGVERIW